MNDHALYDAVAALGGSVSELMAKLGDIEGDLLMLEMRMDRLEGKDEDVQR